MHQYRALGMRVMRIAGVDETWLGEAHCIALVHWHSEFEGAGDIDFDVAYLVRVGDDGAARVFG